MRQSLVEKIALFKKTGSALIASKDVRKQYEGNAYLVQAHILEGMLEVVDNTTLYRLLNEFLERLAGAVNAYERTRELNLHPGVNDAYKGILKAFK